MPVCALVGTPCIYALIIGIRKWVRNLETSNKNIDKIYGFIHGVGEKLCERMFRECSSGSFVIRIRFIKANVILINEALNILK